MTDAEHAHARRWAGLALLAMAQFVVVLDASIVNVALPSIGRDLELSEDGLSWVVNAYVLPFGGFLLLGGRLADLLGRRRVFMAGLVLFGIASLAGGLATNEGQLIAARAVQGLGAAILSPAALSIVTILFEDGAERNKALGVWGAVAGSGGAAGVLLGGVLTDQLGWEWIFFVNTPIVLIAAALAPTLLHESRMDVEKRTFDFPGAFTVTAGLSLLVYGLVEAPKNGWASTGTIVFLAVATTLLTAFLLIERHSREPMMPFRIFQNRTRTGAYVIGLLIGASLFSMFFFISLYMQNVLGYKPLKAGVAYLPLASVIIVSAGLAAHMVTKIGFKPALVLGTVLVTIGLFLFSRISSPGTYLGDVLPASIVAAAGLGFAFVPVTIAAVTEVSENDSGLASGIINTAQQVGGALGLAVLVTISTSYITNHAAGPQPSLGVLTDSYSRGFLVGCAIAALGVVASLTLISGKASRAHAAGEAPAAVESRA